MPRVIGENVVNTIRIDDSIGGGQVVLYFRSPTTRERVAYQAKSFKLTGNRKAKAKLRLAETRQEFGLKILTDIREGDVLFKSPGGDVQPLTAKTPGWKESLIEYAPDLVETVALTAFEGAAASWDDEDDADDDFEDEADEPGE